MGIEKFITKTVVLEERTKKVHKPTHLTSILKISDTESEPAKFEKQVSNFLYENKDELGILNVFALENMLVDSVIELKDGQFILVECKLALNWHNACNARVEIQRFIAEKLYKPHNLKAPRQGFILFKKFSGDWERTASRKNENGWNFFYEEEYPLRKAGVGIPLDIIQFKGNGELVNPLIPLKEKFTH